MVYNLSNSLETACFFYLTEFAHEGKLEMSSENKRNDASEQMTSSNRLISEFNLLTDQNKMAYIRLSVFPDDFERDAFEAVFLAPYQRIEEWAESGLVEIVSNRKSGQVRYRIPECVGTLMAEGLEKSGETLENQLRFARHFACFQQKSKGTAPANAIDPKAVELRAIT